MTFKRYEMTPEQHRKLLSACESVPYIAAQCGPISPPQERINEAWRELGKEMGFDYMSVRAVPGQPETIFEALPREGS